jgi:hypothetical protein
MTIKLYGKAFQSSGGRSLPGYLSLSDGRGDDFQYRPSVGNIERHALPSVSAIIATLSTSLP